MFNLDPFILEVKEKLTHVPLINNLAGKIAGGIDTGTNRLSRSTIWEFE